MPNLATLLLQKGWLPSELLQSIFRRQVEKDLFISLSSLNTLLIRFGLSAWKRLCSGKKLWKQRFYATMDNSCTAVRGMVRKELEKERTLGPVHRRQQSL